MNTFWENTLKSLRHVKLESEGYRYPFFAIVLPQLYAIETVEYKDLLISTLGNPVTVSVQQIYSKVCQIPFLINNRPFLVKISLSRSF